MSTHTHTRTSRAAAATLAVAIACAGLALTTRAAGAATFVAQADAWVDSSQPTRNFGSRTSLRTDSSPARWIYLRFAVTGSGGASTGVLHVHLNSATKTGLTVHRVVDTTWNEGTINAGNAPPLGPAVASSGPAASGVWQSIHVPIEGDGVYSFALVTASSTAVDLSSREGPNPPYLVAPPPPNPSPFVVSRLGASSYEARGTVGDVVHTGTLKQVVEAAVRDLMSSGGGIVHFGTGTFDLGNSHFEFYDIRDVTFEGEGMDATVIRNEMSIADDTEPFDVVGTENVVLRDFSVFAGGPPRSTSDALDFDKGNNTTIERVKVLASRGRGIVFDGKNDQWTSQGNVVRDCVIQGVPGDGIELLASSANRIEGCVITDVGGYGIQLVKSSPLADQPNKPPDDNVVHGNTIVNAGLDGINVIAGNRNTVSSNVVRNSSDDTNGRDGIRLTSSDSVPCDDNRVEGNLATDDQPVKTQRYGLHIASSLCRRTVVVGDNDFSGNLLGPVRDVGTGTTYAPVPDAGPPSTPTGVTAVATGPTTVDVAWEAATDDVGVTGYTVHRDGAPIGVAGPHDLTYHDATAAPGVTHSYEVDAFDAAGNHSARSSPPATVEMPPAPSELVLAPGADAYVSETSPTRNYGSSSTLRVDGSPIQRSYLAFDVVGAAGATNVSLRVWATSGSTAGIVVRDTTGEWTEPTITYALAPAPGPDVLASSGPFPAGSWVTLDLTAVVTADGPRTFVLEGTSTTGIAFGSRESATPPVLVVTL